MQIILNLDRTDSETAGTQWGWRTTIKQADQVIATYRQSTLQGMILNTQNRQKRASPYIPQRTRSIDIDQLILSTIDDKTSLETIANRLRETYPE
ncbi:MAG: hypothetical protein AAF629_26590 [Chloroflexota bacterium]